jgi:hypothetical protein
VTDGRERAGRTDHAVDHLGRAIDRSERFRSFACFPSGAPLMLEVSSATGSGRGVYLIPTTMESGPTSCSR